jgi:hypothetical protein
MLNHFIKTPNRYFIENYYTRSHFIEILLEIISKNSREK